MYRSAKGFIAVENMLSPTFRAGKPTVLFAIDQNFWTGAVRGSSYSIMPDGQPFVFIIDAQMKPIRQFCVVINWFEELKRLVPVK